MKISGGSFRGKSLKTPKGRDIRPTSDKVRQAVFNMLHARGAVAGANVLDAFCGSGALGLEALSQGVDFCTFWDNSRDSLKLCQENITVCGMEARSKISLRDAAKPVPKPEEVAPIDLVFLDPPYGKDLISKSLEALLQGDWLAAESIFVLEMGVKESASFSGLEILQEKTYGDTKIILAQRAPE